MTTTLEPPVADITDESVPETPLRLRRFDQADIGRLAGAAVAAFCLDWLVYERLTPLSGGLGFWVCWYVAFLAIYGFMVRDARGSVAAKDRVAAVVMTTAGIGLVVPLTFILGYVVFKGYHALRLHFLWENQAQVGPLSKAAAGGAGHAIVGTLEQVGLATLICVPLGVLSAFFLNEVGGRLARPLRTVVDAMSAVPSILCGLFVYAAWIIAFHQQFSGFAAALALSVLMLPTVTRTTEVVLRLVPGGLREGALALGGEERRVARLVVLPTARIGIVTGIILGIARVVGETAPLFFTAFGSNSMNWNPFSGPQSSLTLFTWTYIRSSQANDILRAWAAAFVLTVLVLILFVIARLIGGRRVGEIGFLRRAIQNRRSSSE